MLGASTIINPIIKIVTTVVILGAIYLFFVKPALDTVDEVSSGFSESFSEGFSSFDDAQDIFEEAGVEIDEPASASQKSKLLDCLERAQQDEDLDKVERCAEKFG